MKVPDLPLAMDACVLVNLAAAFPLAEMSDRLDRPILVSHLAKAEVRFLHDLVDGESMKREIDTSGINSIDLEDEELGLFVELANRLDDGESSTLAIAQKRDCVAVTDDRAARKQVARLGLSCPVIGTPTLLRHYVERVGLGDVDVVGLLRRVEVHARYTPARHDPDFAWWVGLVS